MSDLSSPSPASDATPSFISPVLMATERPTTPPVRLGVLASGSGSNFEAIAQAIADGKLHARIEVMVYNNPGVKAVARAERWGIPAVLVNHREFSQRETCDRKIVETLREYGVEWVIMAGWMRVVTPTLLDAFPDRMINIHPSLLPSFPGLRAVEQAIAAGVRVSGCTVHLVRLEVDSGPILMQAAVPVLPSDTAESLHARIQVQEHRIFPQAIALATQQAIAGGWDA